VDDPRSFAWIFNLGNGRRLLHDVLSCQGG